MSIKKEVRNPVKAIRAKCLDCCCGSFSEISLCPAEKCPLYPFRFGKNPYRAKRELSSEQKDKLRRLGSNLHYARSSREPET